MQESSTVFREAAGWVALHQALLDHTVAEYLQSGEWPRRGQLQRDLDRLNVDDIVREAADTMPLLPGQRRSMYDEHFRLPPPYSAFFISRQFAYRYIPNNHPTRRQPLPLGG